MERVQNMILLHGVAYVLRWIAPDTRKTCIEKQLYVSSKEHSVEKKDKYKMFNVNNKLFLPYLTKL